MQNLTPVRNWRPITLIDGSINHTAARNIPGLLIFLLSLKKRLTQLNGLLYSVAAVQSCFCFIIVAAAIVLGIGALFLLFVLLYSQRVASQSCETLGELLHHPFYMENAKLFSISVRH